MNSQHAGTYSFPVRCSSMAPCFFRVQGRSLHACHSSAGTNVDIAHANLHQCHQLFHIMCSGPAARLFLTIDNRLADTGSLSQRHHRHASESIAPFGRRCWCSVIVLKAKHIRSVAEARMKIVAMPNLPTFERKTHKSEKSFEGLQVLLAYYIQTYKKHQHTKTRWI